MSEEDIQAFDELVPKAAKIHMFTWCVKRQMPLFTLHLHGRECCQCRHFIGNDGICDPL